MPPDVGGQRWPGLGLVGRQPRQEAYGHSVQDMLGVKVSQIPNNGSRGRGRPGGMDGPKVPVAWAAARACRRSRSLHHVLSITILSEKWFLCHVCPGFKSFLGPPLPGGVLEVKIANIVGVSTGQFLLVVIMDNNKKNGIDNSKEVKSASDDDISINNEDDYFSEEDYYVSLEDDYISDDDDEEEKYRIVIRGPGLGGYESYDTNCVFGNEVQMNFNQVMLFKSYVEKLPRPPIKEYVCTMTINFVKNEGGEMQFAQGFTSTYLMQFLMAHHSIRLSISARSQVVSLVVNKTTSSANKYCRLRLDESGKVKINVGWSYAVKEFNLQEGDVYMFSFKDERHISSRRRDQCAWLRMVILKLEE